jgi:hypothetical protein
MKTVQIKPQIAFANGKKMSATQLNVVSISDNLFDHVVFKYTLLDEAGVWAGESTFELKGLEDYSTWDATAEGAFTIVAQNIGLVVVQSENKTVFVDLS